jgi:DNA mismatch repair protein MutS2
MNPAAWRLGMQALTPAGLEGRIVSLESGGRRATLEAGGLRVTADVADLLPASHVDDATWWARSSGERGPSQGPAADGPVSGRRGDFGAEQGAERTASTIRSARSGAVTGRTGPPARSVASSLDLRGARVEEALELLERYIDQAATAEAGRVTVIHGHGTGALRDSVREHLTSHPLVREWRAGERGEGGDGATIVSL